MENLVGVFRALGKNGVKKYGYSYVKSQVDALEKCKKKLEDGETLQEIWLCKWRDVPSKYTLIYGVETPENKVPNLDFCEQLRSQHLSQKNVRGRPARGGIKDQTKSLIVHALESLRDSVKPKDTPKVAKPHIKLPSTQEGADDNRSTAQKQKGIEFIMVVATAVGEKV